MKRFITVTTFVLIMLSVVAVLSHVTDNFETFRLNAMAENANVIVDKVKGWFRK